VSVPIRLVLVDDHPIVLQGLEQLFGFEPDMEVVARCLSAQQALSAMEEHRPDVLVLDIRMPDEDGLAVLRELHTRRIRTRVILLTAAVDEDEVVEAMRLGVRGIVLKEAAPQNLVDAIRRVHAGETVVDHQAVVRALEKVVRREAGTRRLAAVLTARELEIVRMVVAGLRNKEIATRLTISESTVKIHLHNTYEKLKVDGRLELMLFAQEHGLI
jgi:DNA-binding NarL/FixJ family response regulator